MEVSPSLIGYLLVINLITLVSFGADKISAVSGAWRVRERTLFLLSLFGGSAGAMLATFLFRHKRSKSSFMAVISLILLLQLAALLYFFGGNLQTTPDSFTY